METIDINNNKDHVVLICSHSNTEFKKQTLLECIDSVKNLNYDIILTSHYAEEKDVISKVDYFIFDTYDPIIKHEEYYKNKIINFVFWEDPEFRIDWTIPFIHDYSVFNCLRNGCLYAKALNKKFIHVIEYDCLVDKDLFIKEMVTPLQSSDVSYSIWDKNIKHLMAAYMFSFRSDAFVGLFESITKKEDFFNDRHFNWQLERILNDYRLSNSLKSYLNNYPQHLMNRNQLFQQTNILNAIRPCIDTNGKLYLHISSKSECLINVTYGSFNKFKKISDPITFEIGDYRPNEPLQVFYEGKNIYNKTLDLPVNEFYHLNKLRSKKDSPFYSYITEGFNLGMRQNYEEIEEFCRFLSDKNIKNFVEIGTDQGGSFLILSKMSDPNGIKISIDLPYSAYGINDFDINKRNEVLKQLPGQIFILEENSHDNETFIKIQNILKNEKIDLLFIDGDHSFDGVKQDFEMYSKLVKNDGLIVFHDITYSPQSSGELINAWEFWNMLEGDKTEFTSRYFWGGFGVVIKNDKLQFNEFKVKTLSDINYNFINGAFCEVLSDKDQKYSVTFAETTKKTILYKTEIKNNSWSKTYYQYFVPYRIQVSNVTEKGLIFDHTLNLLQKNVYISLESKSLGDTLAWVPYVEEFRKLHNCNLICSTFWNDLFIDSYPAITFVEPGMIIDNLYAMYEVGIFHDSFKEPHNYKTIPLQQVASNILGLDYKETKPCIYVKHNKRRILEPYVTISTGGTASAKLWHCKNGWQDVIDYLNKKNLKVVLTQLEDTDLHGVIVPDDKSIDNTINLIKFSKFHIGTSSGPIWLAFALKFWQEIILISGFTDPKNEFKCRRIYPIENICKGCYNRTDDNDSGNKDFFDFLTKEGKGDWNFCPIYKNTPNQFQCSHYIKSSQVIEQIDLILANL